MDLSLRYSRTIGDADIGFYHFVGTSREPTLLLGLRNNRTVLIPNYEQINQTGLDVQMVAGNGLFKG